MGTGADDLAVLTSRRGFGGNVFDNGMELFVRLNRVDAKGRSTILFGRTAIDLSAVEQLVSVSQTRGLPAGPERDRPSVARVFLRGGPSDPLQRRSAPLERDALRVQRQRA